MTWAPQKTQEAVYLALKEDAPLGELLGASPSIRKIFDFAPDDSPYPYVTMQIKPWQERGNHTSEGWQCELQINVWNKDSTRGDRTVQAIQNRIDEVLHLSDICVDGWDNLGFRRTFVDILTEPDNVTKHGVQRFNLLLGEN